MSALPALLTRLEKAATDNGFDQELAGVGAWRVFASTHAPLEVWLTVGADEQLVVAFSRADVAQALTDHGTPTPLSLPAGAAAARVLPSVPELNRLLRRAYQLARTLPNELLRDFEEKTAALPRATEAERLVVQRVGQDIFRNGLLDYWDGQCPLTGLTVHELLRASHIKPWADCTADAERLDVFNGLLLAPQFDAAFDRGFIAFSDDGALAMSAALAESDRMALGLTRKVPRVKLSAGHRAYLAWHRMKVFKG